MRKYLLVFNFRMWRDNHFLKNIAAVFLLGLFSFFPHSGRPHPEPVCFLAPPSFAVQAIPLDGPPEYRKEAVSFFQEVGQMKQFLGVQAIHSARYEVLANHRPNYNPILKFFVRTERGESIFYAKLFDPLNKKNATREEALFTLAASQAGITPPSVLFDKALVLREIENGISLWDLLYEPDWLQFFMEHREELLQKIGQVYSVLNRKLGIFHRDVALRHIFITKERKVYLIDYSTLCEKNEIYLEGVLSKKITRGETDLGKVMAYLRNFLDDLRFKYPEEFEKRGLTPRDVILLLNQNFLSGYFPQDTPNNSPLETSL